MKTQGFLDSKRVNAVFFYTVGLSIFFSMIIAILSVWEFVGTNIAGRTISTLLIVIVACGAFAFSNKLFGPKVE